MTDDARVPTEVWGLNAENGSKMHADVERTDVDEVALFTFDDDGEGSRVSLYWSVERAREMAYLLLKAARPR